MEATGWDDDDNNWWMKLAAYTYLSDGKVSQVDYGNAEKGSELSIDIIRGKLVPAARRQSAVVTARNIQ